MEYRACTALQERVLEKVRSGERPDTLLFVEHDPVLTLGASFHTENLLLSKEEYARRGIAIEETGRGGDVTYHGPGQLVAYPIFDLSQRGKDLHLWLRKLEETVIRAVAGFGLEGYRFPPNTGVWVKERKIAAIGVKVKRWVSMHGIALNCNNDLTPFGLIVPCGIRSHGVTSLTEEVGRDVSVGESMPHAIRAFEEVFGLELVQSDRC
jgi:lipoyl(octanoyl) transferase